MDKIWDRKSFEVGSHWPLWRGWKNEWPRRTDKSRLLKKIKWLHVNLTTHTQIILKKHISLWSGTHLSSWYPPHMSWQTNSFGLSCGFLGLLATLATHNSSVFGCHDNTSSTSNNGLHTGFLLSIYSWRSFSSHLYGVNNYLKIDVLIVFPLTLKQI